MEGKKLCKTLPDSLVERIIAMIPFPEIFQARCLSKSWHARFSSSASQDDGAMKGIVSSFQMLLSERSKNWETFCPVFIGSNRDLIAYDKKAHDWRKLPSVSFLPDNVHIKHFDMQIEGARFYASDFIYYEEMYVANILTRTWKRLPLPPTAGCPVFSSKLVVTDKSSETYKVVSFCQRDMYDEDLIFVQIYDSKPGSWSSMRFDFKLRYSYGPPEEFTCTFLDGVFYFATEWVATTLFAVNIKLGTVKELELSATSDIPWECDRQLVVCKGKLLMVLSEDSSSTSPIVLKIDVDSLIVTVLNDCPPSLDSLESSSRAMEPVGDEDHIFFGYAVDSGSRMRAYNIETDRWSSSFAFPSSECRYDSITSFQPGFGPFVAV